MKFLTLTCLSASCLFLFSHAWGRNHSNSLINGHGKGRNSTYTNPILPGFHPDPSCIFIKELEETFFCVSSSFLAFPGLPIHASKDLVNWKLIGNALSRPE